MLPQAVCKIMSFLDATSGSTPRVWALPIGKLGLRHLDMGYKWKRREKSINVYIYKVLSLTTFINVVWFMY